MAATPTFDRPPIVELVLGVQFSPLTKLRAAHFGLYWKQLSEEWVEAVDGPLLEDQFELFDRSKGLSPSFLLRVEPLRLPSRFLVKDRNKERQIQMQSTRFHFNWQKQSNCYPSYKTLIVEFEGAFKAFENFVSSHMLGPLALNQWELTYVNSFPRFEYWDTPADWPKVLPGLFGNLFASEGLGIELEHRAAQWSYEIIPKQGRLHISAQPSTRGDHAQDTLLLQITARGPIEKDGISDLRTGLDLGHDVAVGSFLRVVDEDIQRGWGQKP